MLFYSVAEQFSFFFKNNTQTHSPTHTTNSPNLPTAPHYPSFSIIVRRRSASSFYDLRRTETQKWQVLFSRAAIASPFPAEPFPCFPPINLIICRRHNSAGKTFLIELRACLLFFFSSFSIFIIVVFLRLSPSM